MSGDVDAAAEMIRRYINAEVLDVPPSDFSAVAESALAALVAEVERLQAERNDLSRRLGVQQKAVVQLRAERDAAILARHRVSSVRERELDARVQQLEEALRIADLGLTATSVTAKALSRDKVRTALAAGEPQPFTTGDYQDGRPLPGFGEPQETP